ncbi:helix-turn-helix domain-containing protein [Selenihalanaerobacter shriftii]|uniref:Helix-turn-helix n=1 Tax=Selenihalanaerobacter shriftii TaxID=142842 RepID=A0A1T4QIM8_9FIRM|nr:helix-turn-helix transcriptional regulator [Selenihalanaerobacter shriftii]SKA03559.1 Helix-turn-helix [Selenihalanaerobacter shriftii]
MSKFNKLVGARIQDQLDKIEWSQAQLAEKLDTSRQVINKIIHGRKNITIQEVKSIANILNVDLQQLIQPFDKEEDKEPIITFMGEVNSKGAKKGLQHAQNIMDLVIFHRDIKDNHQKLFSN